MSKLCPIVTILLLSLSALNAQNGFNKKYNLSLPILAFYNLTIDQNEIFLSGLSVDSQQYFIISKIDTFGNLIKSVKIRDSLGVNLFLNLNYSLIKLENGNLLMVGVSSGLVSVIVEFNNNLEVQKFNSYDFENYFVVFQRNVIETTNGLLFVGDRQRQDYTYENFIFKVNEQREKIWEKSFLTPSANNVSFGVRKLNENLFIIISSHVNVAGTPVPNFWGQSWFFAIDSLGNKLWEFEGPVNDETYAAGLQQTPDGGWLYGSGIFEVLNSTEYGLRSKIVRRDSQWNLVNETVFSPTAYSTNRIRDIVPSPDGNYIVVGEWTTPQTPGIANYGGGSIVNVTPDGDTLWSRLFTGYPNQPKGSANYLGGAAVLPSGSIVAAGYTQRFSPSYVAPMGWVLKISPDGCVVDTLCATSATAVPVNNPIVPVFRPNPADGYAFLSFSQPVEQDYTFRLTDAYGRLVKSEALPRGVYTYSLPVMNYPSGWYCWVLQSERGSVARGVLLVQH